MPRQIIRLLWEGMKIYSVGEKRKMKKYFNVNVEKYSPNKHYFVVRPASLQKPKDHAVMFIMEKYMEKAGVFESVENCLIFWPESHEIPDALMKHAIVPCENPHEEYCRFYKDNHITYLPEPEEIEYKNGSWIAEGAMIGDNAMIMPGCYISGETRIGNNVYIGCGTKIMGEVTIGDRVVIRENSVIGADGLSTDRDANGVAITMPQFGSVVIEDDVQIGALTVVARGAIDETVISRGSKIDNSTFISHNVHIGNHSFIVGETIMFGSSSVGDKCLVSGNSTIMNVVHVGDEAIVGAGSVVTRSVESGEVVLGNPAKSKMKK